MKDNFSIQSQQYVKFRPTYPKDLYDILFSLVEEKYIAWDCGTGNGQVAQELATHFEKVYATDISEAQIKNAAKKDNIIYKVEGAEETSFNDQMFNLITVAQAIHWFNFTAFYNEVKRTMKQGGVLAVIGYGLISTGTETDSIIDKFYHNIVGSYWDKERKYVDENYKTIPFPFKEIEVPVLYNTFEWTFEQMIGYFETWSAVQHYIKANDQNPIDLIFRDLKNAWGQKSRTVRFPVLLRVAKIG